jgi:hypothetical protein
MMTPGVRRRCGRSSHYVTKPEARDERIGPRAVARAATCTCLLLIDDLDDLAAASAAKPRAAVCYAQPMTAAARSL